MVVATRMSSLPRRVSFDKDLLSKCGHKESMATAVATPSADWHSNNDEVVVDNDSVDKDSDAFVVNKPLTCSRSRRVM
jgi:hypothetical protein